MLLKPIITIDTFNAGILEDKTQPATNGGQMFYGLDIHNDDSVIQVSQKMTRETNVFTDLVKWVIRDDNSSFKYWALGDTGNLYKVADVGGTWALDSNIGGHGNGYTLYNGERWHCTDTALVGSTSGSNTIDSDTDFHPLCVFLGSLFGGAGRYIFKKESDGTFTARALPLPLGYKVKSLRVFGDVLVIGTWKGTNIYDEADSLLFTWNGTSEFPNQPFGSNFNECGMNALELWENILLTFAGIGGNVYAFNNAFLDKAKKIPNVGSESGGYVYVNPGAVSQFGGNCLAGVSVGSGSAFGGVYTFGRKTEDLPFAMTFSHPISTGNTSVVVGAVFTAGNKVLVSWKDGANYGMDCLDLTAKYSSGYMESQKYEIAEGNKPRLVKGALITADPLPTGTSITVKYDADNSGSFTTVGTITSSNQNEMLSILIRAKVFQPQFILNANGNDSPKIHRIDIF